MLSTAIPLAPRRRLFPRHSLQGTSMVVNDAAVGRNNRQEKLPPSATLRRSAVAASRNLLCGMQR
jgi:hypothetical protein